MEWPSWTWCQTWWNYSWNSHLNQRYFAFIRPPTPLVHRYHVISRIQSYSAGIFGRSHRDQLNGTDRGVWQLSNSSSNSRTGEGRRRIVFLPTEQRIPFSGVLFPGNRIDRSLEYVMALSTQNLCRRQGSLLFMRSVSLTLTGLVSAWRRGEAPSTTLAKPLSDCVTVFYLRQCKSRHLKFCEILKKYLLFSNKLNIFHS